MFRLEMAPDGSSFVTHSLSVNKRRMEEFVQYLEKGERDSWPWRILRSIDPNYIDMGFSEYASYISWMKQNHPSEIVSKRARYGAEERLIGLTDPVFLFFFVCHCCSTSRTRRLGAVTLLWPVWAFQCKCSSTGITCAAPQMLS